MPVRCPPASAPSPPHHGTRPPRWGALTGAFRLSSCDVVDGHVPGSAPRSGPYWHQPGTLEAYYDAQMDLCTPHPAFDLHDPAWPLPAVPLDAGPAKVVSDAAGRSGQALNALVSEGAVIRGGVVMNTVVGHPPEPVMPTVASIVTASTSGRSSRSTFTFTKRSFMTAAVVGSSKDSCAMT